MNFSEWGLPKTSLEAERNYECSTNKKCDEQHSTRQYGQKRRWNRTGYRTAFSRWLNFSTRSVLSKKTTCRFLQLEFSSTARTCMEWWKKNLATKMLLETFPFKWIVLKKFPRTLAKWSQSFMSKFGGKQFIFPEQEEMYNCTLCIRTKSCLLLAMSFLTKGRSNAAWEDRTERN